MSRWCRLWCRKSRGFIHDCRQYSDSAPLFDFTLLAQPVAVFQDVMVAGLLHPVPKPGNGAYPSQQEGERHETDAMKAMGLP